MSLGKTEVFFPRLRSIMVLLYTQQVFQHGKENEPINCIQLYYTGDPATAKRQLHVVGWLENIDIKFNVRNYRHRHWNHLCWSYSSSTGMTVLYFNGKLAGNIRQAEKGHTIKSYEDPSDSSFIIGQEMDDIDDGFDSEQMFLGELTELNMWDRVLENVTIKHLSECKDVGNGNMISWRKENFKFFDSNTYDIALTELCSDESKLVVFPQMYNYEESKTVCASHGGTILTPRSDLELSLIHI